MGDDFFESGPLGFLYDTAGARDREPFESYWCGPARIGHGETAVVARYPQKPDGYEVEIRESRWPARFHEIVATRVNPRTGRHETLSLGTGSGMAQLAHKIALALSEGMLALRESTEENPGAGGAPKDASNGDADEARSGA